MRKIIYINNREIAHLEYHKTPKGCHINNIFVEEKHRGEGYGKQLIEKLAKYELVTVVPTPETLKFWYRLGFRKDSKMYFRENKKPYVNTELFIEKKVEIAKTSNIVKVAILLSFISYVVFALYHYNK